MPETYLDDRTQLKGTRLKLLCRLNCLPVMDRVGREVKPKWPKHDRVCFACGSNDVEDVHHFIMAYPRYAAKRAGLIARVRLILSRATGSLTATAFGYVQPGAVRGDPSRRIGDPIAENRIDAAAKRYLTKAWNLRVGVTASINAALDTAYDVQACALAARNSSRQVTLWAAYGGSSTMSEHVYFPCHSVTRPA